MVHRGDLRQLIGHDSVAPDYDLAGAFEVRPIFDRNQGERARTRAAVAQAREQEAEVSAQVLTDVADAYAAFERTRRIIDYYRSGYLDASQRSRDISEYAYRRGATSLFDFLDAAHLPDHAARVPPGAGRLPARRGTAPARRRRPPAAALNLRACPESYDRRPLGAAGPRSGKQLPRIATEGLVDEHLVATTPGAPGK